MHCEWLKLLKNNHILNPQSTTTREYEEMWSTWLLGCVVHRRMQYDWYGGSPRKYVETLALDMRRAERVERVIRQT